MPLLPKEPQIFPEAIFDWFYPWRVAHVRSRQEKALARHLLQNGIAFYLPQIVKSKTRLGRGLVSYVPLFPGYLFFRGGAAERLTALRSNVIANIIEVENQTLLTDELQQIRRLQLAGASLIPVQEYVAGDAVRIKEGAFAGYEGVVVRTAKRDRLLVSISLLRKAVAVEFPRTAINRRRR